MKPIEPHSGVPALTLIVKLEGVHDSASLTHPALANWQAGRILLFLQLQALSYDPVGDASNKSHSRNSEPQKLLARIAA